MPSEEQLQREARPNPRIEEMIESMQRGQKEPQDKTDATKNEAIIENKALRQALDVILQQVKNSPRQSRERSLVRTKLEESIMWLGMDLKDLGTPNPYPNSKDPSNTIVDKTADGLKL
jgi:hypothetical protein